MTWFLRAKHWQIFILLLVVPVVFELFGAIAIALTHRIEAFIVCVFVVMLIAMIIQFGWFYTVGSALGEKLGSNSGMNVKRFRSFVLVPAFYITAFILLMLIFMLSIFENGFPSPYFAFAILIIFPLHLFSIFCIFYSIWFIAKSLKMVEKWNHVEIGDYIGDFFLVWFLVIGIWFIQPRINRLFDSTLPPSPPKNPNYPPMQSPSDFYNPQYPPPNYNPYFNNPDPPIPPPNDNPPPPNTDPPDYSRFQPPTQ